MPRELESERSPGDSFRVRGWKIYLHTPNGVDEAEQRIVRCAARDNDDVPELGHGSQAHRDGRRVGQSGASHAKSQQSAGRGVEIVRKKTRTFEDSGPASGAWSGLRVELTILMVSARSWSWLA